MVQPSPLVDLLLVLFDDERRRSVQMTTTTNRIERLNVMLLIDGVPTLDSTAFSSLRSVPLLFTEIIQ